MTASMREPINRPRVLLGTLCVLALLVGVVMIAEVLRHPPAVTPGPLEADAGDVRDEISCPGTSPRSGPMVSSDELNDCPADYDGRAVVYEGEVVGALLTRRDGAWVQLNDDVYAGDLGPLPAHRDFRGGNAGIGVFLPAGLVDMVEMVGGPAARGDVLRITGVFHRVDPASGEVAVIRANGAEVRSRGAPIVHEPLRDRRIVGGILALLAAAVTVVFRRGRE